MRLSRKLIVTVVIIGLCVSVGSVLALHTFFPSTTELQQTIDDVSITLAIPNNPGIYESHQFRVRLTDATGQPMNDAHVYLDLDMPAMPMGINQPIADARSNGVYETSTVYTMDGLWSITVIATVEDQEYRAVFFTEVPE
ncbi:MAG: FixH family protein [Chloroflexota bacterium]